MAADGLGERGRAAHDTRWGRLGGAHPPLRASVPLVGWLLNAVVVTAVVLGVVGGPGPLDDPSQGDQRPGFIVDPDEARVVPGLRLPGAPVGRRPVFVAFDRRVPPSDRLRDGVDDVAEGFAVVLVVPRAPVRRVAAIHVAVDPAGRVARAVGIDHPRDGGGPIGYARAQGDPAATVLAHTRYGPTRSSQLLLLHGLGASRAVWQPVAIELERQGIATLVPDLLGFGASRTIGTRFLLADHTAAVRVLLDHYRAESVVVVGHSFGRAVAVALADAEPDRVRAVVLVSPPAFRDSIEARVRLGERGWLARHVLAGSPVASVTCGAMCLLRRPAAALLARFARTLPERVARDGVQHTWPAYRDALTALLEDNPVHAALEAPRRPTTVVLGDADPETPAEDVLDWPHDRVRVIEVPGADHLLPLRRPQAVLDAAGAALL